MYKTKLGENKSISETLERLIKKLKKNTITICTDLKNDSKGLLTLLYSIDKYCKTDYINILTLKEHSEEILMISDNFKNLEIKIIEVDNLLWHVLPAEEDKNNSSLSHITNFAYCRMLIPKIISNHENTLYLDTDVMINKNFSIENLAPDADGIFAVRNGHHAPDWWFEQYQGVFDSSDEVHEKAFNSGVILFKMKSKEYSEQIFNKLTFSVQKNNFSFMDQTHLNFVLKDEIKYLDERFNLPHHSKGIEKSLFFNEDNAFIIHFGSSNKP